jgi:hypothetical protein
MTKSLKHLTVLTPSGGQVVGSPVKISGYVNSDGWATGSGNVGTVVLYDSLNRKLGQISLSAKGDKSKMPIAFEGSLSFSAPLINTGVLVFTSQSTSTFLKSAEKEVRLAVRFAPKGQIIKVNSPRYGSQLVESQPVVLEWTASGTSKVSLYLINEGLELLGTSQAMAWKVENIQNSGSYKTTLSSVPPGNYNLFITDGTNSGRSGTFYVFSRAQVAGQPPVITELNGPTSLKIGQSGSWQIKASDLDKDKLTFSVSWGDGSGGPPGISSLTDQGVWVASFDHSYGLKFDYPVAFVVTDDKGLSSQRTLTVKVVP